MDMPNLEVEYFLVYSHMVYSRETKETKDISKWQAKFSPNGVLSTEFIHDTHRLSTRVRLMEKSNVTWFLFLRRKVDTMSSIRISYNDTLTFKKNMLIGWDFLKNPFLKNNNNSSKIYIQ